MPYHDPAVDFHSIEVCLALGIEPEKHLTWSVGLIMRHAYEERYGLVPPKELRIKTCGIGVHCFAIYKGWFWPEAEEIWLMHASPRLRSGPPPKGCLFWS
jgi:hypothetical protein